MKTTWQKVMDCKKADTRHKGCANTLTTDEIQTIAGVVEFFGGSVQMTVLDLARFRYRVFDWLAMCVMGDRINSTQATKVLVYSFLECNGDIDKFIDDLRAVDYEIMTDWETLTLE